MILVSSGYDCGVGPAAAVATWLLLAILLWLNNGLRYIWSRSEFNVAEAGQAGQGSGTEVRDTRLPKKEAKMSIEQFIDNEVKSNDVVLFMKGTPQFPQCGFSGQVVQILDHVGVGYKGLNVLESADLRNGIKTYSNWPTIPQLYVKGEFVGGCDIIREMFQAGELQQLFADKGVAVSTAASA
jgi:monothiol glutaredoxin